MGRDLTIPLTEEEAQRVDLTDPALFEHAGGEQTALDQVVADYEAA